MRSALLRRASRPTFAQNAFWFTVAAALLSAPFVYILWNF